MAEIKTDNKKPIETACFLNIGEAARYLGFTKGYLYRLTAARLIPFYRPMGRKILFKQGELEEWVNKKRVPMMIETRGYHG